MTLGLLATAVASRTMERFLFGVAPSDPFTLIVVVAMVCGVAGIATFLPWHRATAIDPLETLRRG